MAKRLVSIITMLALLLTAVSVMPFSASADDVLTNATWPTSYNTFWPDDYAALESDTEVEGLTFANAFIDSIVSGKRLVDGEGNSVKGSFIFKATHDITAFRVVTSFSEDPGFLGGADVYYSVDGKLWTKAEATDKTETGTLWGGASVWSEVYKTYSVDVEGVRYIKVHLDPKSFPTALGLHRVDYVKSAEAVTYTNTVAPTAAIDMNSTGTLGGTSFGYAFLENGNAVNGTLTFASPDFAPITEFNAYMFMNYVYIQGALVLEVSSDGVNFSRVSPTYEVKEDGNVNASWGCRDYNVYGSFKEEENVRFIRITLIRKAVTDNSIYHFQYNTGASTEYYDGVLDVTSAETTEGTVLAAGGHGGYLLKDASNNPVSGDAIYSFPNGIAKFAIRTVEYGHWAHSYSASADGVTWTPVSVSSVFVQQGFGQDGGLQVFDRVAQLSPAKGYKYIKVHFNNADENGNPNGAVPVIVSGVYMTAADVTNPLSSDTEMAESYAVSKLPQDGFATSEGTLTNFDGVGFVGWTGASTGYLFVKDGARVPGTLDYYSEEPIANFRVRKIDGGAATGNINVYVSTDGNVWNMVTPNIAAAGSQINESWGSTLAYYAYGTLATDDIHYIRVENCANYWLSPLPGVESVEYNTIDVTDNLIEVGSIDAINTMEDAEKVAQLYLNKDKLDLTAEQEEWLNKAALAAEAAVVTGAPVSLAETVPQYNSTAMSTVESDTQKFKYDVSLGNALELFADSVINVGETVNYGVLYIGRNATREQMKTLMGVEGYYVETVIDDLENFDFNVEVERYGAEPGKRTTVLPYVRFVLDGEELVFFADEVISKSPMGWLKQAIPQAKGTDAYTAKVAEMAAAADYAEIGENMDALFTEIAATANQTEAIAKINTYKADAGAEYYYKLMLDLFSAVKGE